MSMELRVETIHAEAIKPSSPTPINLKNFKLSLLDQMSPVIYIPLIFWYPAEAGAAANDHFPEAAAKERCRRLKKSLSETLTRFYPFAGRISNGSTIECNDEGVDYIEARVDCLLHDILSKQPNAQVLTKFLPIELESTEAATGRLLLVKVNIFRCGGLAIGLSLSHKIADLSTLGYFVNSWAATARGCSSAAAAVVVPEFGCAASFLPPTDNFSSPPPPVVEVRPRENVAVKRLIFDASKISILKARSTSTTVALPTRVEAVAALIWKCMMAASASASASTASKPSVFRQVVNLRNRLKPPLPPNSVGYLVWCFTVQAPAGETELQGLVEQLRNGIKEFSGSYVKNLQGSKAISTIIESAMEIRNLSNRADIDFYHCTSWCRFGLYEADFGWGKPLWVSPAGSGAPNMFLLMDARDGEGIEAWVCLSEQKMAFFERNQELLEFVSGSVFHCC